MVLDDDAFPLPFHPLDKNHIYCGQRVSQAPDGLSIRFWAFVSRVACGPGTDRAVLICRPSGEKGTQWTLSWCRSRSGRPRGRADPCPYTGGLDCQGSPASNTSIRPRADVSQWRFGPLSPVVSVRRRVGLGVEEGVDGLAAPRDEDDPGEQVALLHPSDGSLQRHNPAARATIQPQLMGRVAKASALPVWIFCVWS